MISALSLGLAPPVSTHQRRHAFERVYAEGRWIAGADGAGCKSGWSDVGAGHRAQSLTAPPFSLPPPLRYFSEEYPTDPRVGLGLWKIPLFA